MTKLRGATCCIDGCDEPRRRMKDGRREWRSRFCETHFKENVAERSRNTEVLSPRASFQPVSTVFEAWEHDRYLGIVQHDGRRVYGLKPVGNGYRATVTDMESVLLEADTLLSVWGKE